MSIGCIAILLIFLIGEGPAPADISFAIFIGLLFFPLGTIAGMIIAWFREKTGAFITITCLLLFYLWHQIWFDTFPGGPFYVIFSSPGFLFLICSLFPKEKSVKK